MAIGKREQIVGISILALASIALIHLFIFAPRAEDYNKTLQEFTDGQNQLRDAEVLENPKRLEQYREKTAEYAAQVQSVTSQLNINIPDYFTSDSLEAIMKRTADTTSLTRQLVEMRSTVRQPQLTFLDNRPHPQAPDYNLGWNFPRALPNLGASGAILDTLVQISHRHQLLQSMPDPIARMQQRGLYYNPLLQRIGLNPAEVSHYVVGLPQQNRQMLMVYFNDKGAYEALQRSQYKATENQYSLSRFGVAVPMLKKTWMLDLLIKQLDQRSPITDARVFEMLEIDVPFDQSLLAVNRQLQALIDIIRIAERNQILDISEVKLLRPSDFPKVQVREPGKVPEVTPAPTAAAGARPGVMGGVMGDPSASPGFRAGGGPALPTPVPADQKVGTGTGIELTFRATNPNMIRFLFEVATVPRTYSVDDLHVYASPDGILTTSGTIELLISVDALQKATSAP